MSNVRGSELLIIILLVVLLFGARRLPDAARSIGRSLRIFKAETRGLAEPQDAVAGHPESAAEVEPRDAPSEHPGNTMPPAEVPVPPDEGRTQRRSTGRD